MEAKLIELLALMMKHGYTVEFTPMNQPERVATPPAMGVRVAINGPGFSSARTVQDIPTAIGLVGWWLSESNGVPDNIKEEFTEALKK